MDMIESKSLEQHEYSCKCKDCSLFRVEKLLIENARLRAELEIFKDPEYGKKLKDLTERATESGKLLRENRELKIQLIEEKPPEEKYTLAFTLNLNQQECPACKLKARHTAAEFAQWHPGAGKGFSKEHGAPPEEEKR